MKNIDIKVLEEKFQKKLIKILRLSPTIGCSMITEIRLDKSHNMLTGCWNAAEGTDYEST